MPLDARALGAHGPHPHDTDIFDIDHYLPRSYSAHVPLMARVAPVSLFEQRRQYHTVPCPPSVRDVWSLLRRLFEQARLNAECVIIALIYVERLMETRSLALTPRNWLPVVCMALLSASKVQDDNATFNAEFAAILPIFPLASLNAMERVFLSTISYELYISAETYAQYYFGLRNVQTIRRTKDIPRWYHQVCSGSSNEHALNHSAQQQQQAATAAKLRAAATAKTHTPEPATQQDHRQATPEASGNGVAARAGSGRSNS
jgi:hypothetical protein